MKRNPLLEPTQSLPVSQTEVTDPRWPMAYHKTRDLTPRPG